MTKKQISVSSSRNGRFLSLYNLWCDICHKCRLLSPQLWHNVAKANNIETSVQRRLLWQLFLCLVLPPVLIHAIDSVLLRPREINHTALHTSLLVGRIFDGPRQQLGDMASPATTSTTERLLSLDTRQTVALATIVTVYVAMNGYLLWQVLTPIRKVAALLRTILTTQRSQTIDYTLFRKLCQHGLAIPHFHYDLYLPSSTNDNTHQYHPSPVTEKAILFLPGSGVEHRAYAHVAHLFGQLGYLVVVPSAEPLRQMLPSLGYDAAYFQKRCLRPIGAKYPSIKEWFLVGHSMGGFCGTQIVQVLGIRHIVLWAAAPFVSALANLSDPTHPTCVAVIQASHDAIAMWVKQTFPAPVHDEMVREFWAKLPQHAREYVLPHGSTHAGFASYHSKAFPETNDLFPREEQQKQAVALTHAFLSEMNRKGPS